MDCYIGTIIPWSLPKAPEGWKFCDGELLLIMKYQALFSLLGTTYGGDGVNNFALPDLRGRTVVGTGLISPNSKLYRLGEKGGEERVALSVPQMGKHRHMVRSNVNLTVEKTAGPENNVLGTPDKVSMYVNSNITTNLHDNSIGTTGEGVAHENMQPFLVLNYIICVMGLYPSKL